MLAAVYHSAGPAAEVLRLEELPTPEPGPGEVRVRLRLSGVNPTDWKARQNTAPTDYQIPDQDGAGDIDAVGEGVDSARVGQRVWVYDAAYQRRGGTAAQWTCLPAAQAISLPDDASYELGASLGIPARTAHRALFADGPIRDQTILVAGGAGAVGHYAIELGRWGGAARLIATASNAQKADLARETGADAVVNYHDPDAAEQVRQEAPNGVNRIVEVALGANMELDQAVLAPNGTIATYGTDGPGPQLDIGPLARANTTLRFLLVYEIPQDAKEQAAHDIVRALREWALSGLPTQRFPLADIAAAHEAVENGAVGKVLVEIP